MAVGRLRPSATGRQSGLPPRFARRARAHLSIRTATKQRLQRFINALLLRGRHSPDAIAWIWTNDWSKPYATRRGGGSSQGDSRCRPRGMSNQRTGNVQPNPVGPRLSHRHENAGNLPHTQSNLRGSSHRHRLAQRTHSPLGLGSSPPRHVSASAEQFVGLGRVTVLGYLAVLADLDSEAVPCRRVGMEERDFYDERQETRKSNLSCPHCPSVRGIRSGLVRPYQETSASGPRRRA